MSNLQVSPFATPTLKLVGVILILYFLLDFVVLLFPFKPLDQSWQINFTTHLVEPGLIPLVGLALLLLGYWIDDTARAAPTNRKAMLGLKFWALLFSSLLGLLFLLLFPLHLNNVTQINAQKMQVINQEASQKEAQLQTQLDNPQAKAQLQQQQSQFKAQVNYLLKNEQQLNQLLKSDRVPEEFKNLLRQSQANPKAVDALVQQQISPEGLRNQIQRRKAEAEEQATQEAWKSGARIGITSLLLAIGYIVISWTGLRRMGKARGEVIGNYSGRES